MAENQTDEYNATWIPGYTKPVDLDPYMYPAAHEEKYLTRNEWATSPQMYHNEIMNNYVTNVSKNLSEIPYVGNVLAAGAELGAPVASGILSLPYELKQSFDDFEKKLAANPEQYNSLGSTASGILQAIDDQNPLSTVYHRTKGALRPLGRRLENTWDAIRNEFSGDVEAAEMPIQNRFGNTVGPNPTETILPQEKPLDTSRFQNMYWGPGQLEEAEDVGIETVAPRKNFLRRILDSTLIGRIGNQFAYRPAPLGGAGGYTAAQLDSMNARGGWYSEPAREKRRTINRVKNMMARKAADKSYSQKNLANLSAQISGGRDPSQGNTVTGHGKSGMGRDPRDRMEYGGLATMFQRR